MKNPINYTKEDIYMIVSMANDIYEIDGYLSKNKKEFIEDLINCLTPEERENKNIVKYSEVKEKNSFYNEMKFKRIVANNSIVNSIVKIYEKNHK